MRWNIANNCQEQKQVMHPIGFYSSWEDNLLPKCQVRVAEDKDEDDKDENVEDVDEELN